MKEKNRVSIIIILIGLILWIVYLFATEMSRYGMYTIVSFRMNEILALVPFLCIIFTIGWLISLLTSGVRNRNLKSNLFLSILLIVLCVAQIIYVWNQSQKSSISCVASIESIDEQKMEIVVDTANRNLTLDCPMLVQYLIKTDGTKYYITYEWRKSNPSYGKLCMIQSID